MLNRAGQDRDSSQGREPLAEHGVEALVPAECHRKREFFIDNQLVRIHYIIVMIRWTGLAPWEFELPFQGGLTSTFLRVAHISQSRPDSGLDFQIKVLIDSGLVGSTDFHSSHPQGHEPHTPGTSLGGVPREQKMLKGHLPRVIYHQVY